MAQGEIITTPELRVADVIGGLMEFWGFKRVMGRLWTVVYLSPEPLSAAELGERLALSAGAISMALSELSRWGAVRKSWRPGARRDFYEAETSVWKLVTRVFRERELLFVREAIEAFEAARKMAVQSRPKATSEEKRRLRFVERRVGALIALARIGEGLLTMLLSGGAVDAEPIRTLFDQEEEP